MCEKLNNHTFINNISLIFLFIFFSIKFHHKERRMKQFKIISIALLLFSITPFVFFNFCIVHQENHVQLQNSIDLIELSTKKLPDKEGILSHHGPTFAERMADVRWESLTEGSHDEKRTAWVDLYDRVFKAIIQEPFVPINETCTPPPLANLTDCNGKSKAFTGQLRTTPAKTGHAIQLGFDADVLEIHLNELYDVVDKFFIVEWVSFHNGGVAGAKPLTWEALKHQKRFQKFHDKVVHFVLDDLDTETIKQTANDLFSFERYQEKMRWQKIKEWNDVNKFFKANDMIGFGDTDELPARHNVHLLSNCELKPEIKSVDIGIWFQTGNMDHAFITDFPAAGDRYTLGDPTYWKFSEAEAKGARGDIPSRERGGSGVSLFGGTHLTVRVYFIISLVYEKYGFIDWRFNSSNFFLFSIQ